MTREILMQGEQTKDGGDRSFAQSLILEAIRKEQNFDPEKISQSIARSLCEPTEALYKRDSVLKNDPVKAIEAVKLTDSSESEIKDPKAGLLVAAAKLETAKNELDLSPKQKEVFDGFLENVHGATAWVANASKDVQDFIVSKKIVRKAMIGTTALSTTVTSAGCVNAINTPEMSNTTSPVMETPAASVVKGEPLPTPTKMPTPTPTETAEPTKTAAEETSRYFQPEFQLDLEGTVDGVTIPYTLGLHKSTVERAEEPVKTISVNREDAPGLYAKFWLTICWQKYIQQNPDQSRISFAQYEELVKKGEGEIQVAAVDETTEDQNNKILTYHPEKGFVYLPVDRSVSLPEVFCC